MSHETILADYEFGFSFYLIVICYLVTLKGEVRKTNEWQRKRYRGKSTILLLDKIITVKMKMRLILDPLKGESIVSNGSQCLLFS